MAVSSLNAGVSYQGDMDRSKKLGPISIRLDPDVKAALQELARADERTLSAFINRILRNYVESVRGKRGKVKSDK
jgi:hypothetical protein